MEKWQVSLFFIVLLVGAIFISAPHFGEGQAPNTVKGVIGSDVVWTKENSPYSLAGNIAIDKGATLTVESGVTVNLNNYYIRVNGTLIAKGSSTDKIYLGGSISGEIIFNPSSTNGVIENAIVNASLQINNSSPTIHRNVIMLGTAVSGGSPIISQNTIAITTLSDWVGRPSYRSTAISIGGENTAIIIDNTIAGSLEKAAISISSGSPTITRNNISNSYGYGGETGYWQSGISLSGYCSPTIKDNTITQSAVGIFIDGSPNPRIVSNNIEGNSNYNLRLDTQSNIDVPNNWWGTSNSAAIDQKIYDFNDDFELGKVNYTPFLIAANSQAMPDPNAPIPTPAQTATPSNAPTPTPDTSITPSQNPTATPIQPNTGTSVLFGLDWVGIAIVALLAAIVVLLVFVVVYLRKRSVSSPVGIVAS
ncbi:MAG: right-handed parallel beta-helix repeat-containing protein [Candidatus Bathyarchaeota archaeon]|nr:right-handed parallel beta-helix repeat-containing protein [Candidatus Bathyarchaeota archaeon]